MLEQVMTDQRRRVSGVLVALLGVTMVLWLFRSPEPPFVRVVFVALSILMVPLAYYGTYGILRFNVRVNRITDRALRRACGFFFFGAAGFIVLTATLAVVQVARGSPSIAANCLALGAALGVMRVWDRHVALKTSQ